MMRRIAGRDLPEHVAPRVAALVRAEAPAITAHLSAARERAAIARELTREAHGAVRRALRALLGEALRIAPDHVGTRVDQELARMRRARTLRLRVHPEDAALLETPALLSARLELEGTLHIVPDAEIARGGCVLESELGEIDARIETRLETACACLLGTEPP